MGSQPHIVCVAKLREFINFESKSFFAFQFKYGPIYDQKFGRFFQIRSIRLKAHIALGLISRLLNGLELIMS